MCCTKLNANSKLFLNITRTHNELSRRYDGMTAIYRLFLEVSHIGILAKNYMEERPGQTFSEMNDGNWT